MGFKQSVSWDFNWSMTGNRQKYASLIVSGKIPMLKLPHVDNLPVSWPNPDHYETHFSCQSKNMVEHIMTQRALAEKKIYLFWGDPVTRNKEFWVLALCLLHNIWKNPNDLARLGDRSDTSMACRNSETNKTLANVMPAGIGQMV